MEADRVRLTKDKETYLATLYGKALDAAVEALDRARFRTRRSYAGRSL